MFCEDQHASSPIGLMFSKICVHIEDGAFYAEDRSCSSVIWHEFAFNV